MNALLNCLFWFLKETSLDTNMKQIMFYNKKKKNRDCNKINYNKRINDNKINNKYNN